MAKELIKEQQLFNFNIQRTNEEQQLWNTNVQGTNDETADVELQCSRN